MVIFPTSHVSFQGVNGKTPTKKILVAPRCSCRKLPPLLFFQPVFGRCDAETIFHTIGPIHVDGPGVFLQGPKAWKMKGRPAGLL